MNTQIALRERPTPSFRGLYMHAQYGTLSWSSLLKMLFSVTEESILLLRFTIVNFRLKTFLLFPYS